MAPLDYAVACLCTLVEAELTTIYQELLRHGYWLFIIYEDYWSEPSKIFCGKTSYPEMLCK